MKSVLSFIRNHIPGNKVQIPYLDLSEYNDFFSIPHLQPTFPASHDYTTRTTEIALGTTEYIGILDWLYELYISTLVVLTRTRSLVTVGFVLAVTSTYYAYAHNIIVAYGDAESHLNIAKRVIHSLTPGMAQLGGIWLPLPHLMMLPFVSVDFLWQTGLAGAIVSGIAFIITSVFLYKLSWLLTRNRLASFVAFLVFALNPNILYLQATPMTELPLIMFFVLSSYYFIRFLKKDTEMLPLIGAAVFGLCASLSRYDGWFLVLFEAAILILLYLPKRIPYQKIAGKIVLFSLPAFLGMLLWLGWGYLILGDPFYFTTSEFSARSQQEAWNLRGQLPAYHNLSLSFIYYAYTAMTNVGIVTSAISVVGFVYYLIKRSEKRRVLIALISLCPFVFYVVTLYLGQSVIFIPALTPATFEWRLFNVRYGVMMVPIASLFFAYLFAYSRPGLKVTLLILLVLQSVFFFNQTAETITLSDGTKGLSRYVHTDAQDFITNNYDSGLVLADDFARSFSIIRSGIPMQNIIYIGNKPYWEESLARPETHATWIIMQKDDAVWRKIYTTPTKQARLYKYYTKVYTSPAILIFKRTEIPAQVTPLATSF